MMKDVSLAKSGVTGEKLYYKVQDFVYDDVLFQYCQHKKVHKFIFSKSFENNYMNIFWIDFGLCGVFYRPKYNGYPYYGNSPLKY